MKIPRVLVVAGLLLAMSGAAFGITFSETYGGAIVVSLDDKSSGTLYYPGGAIGGPGAHPGEDAWGIFFIKDIYKGEIDEDTGVISSGTDSLWIKNVTDGQELVGVFWGLVDVYNSTDPNSGTQTIESTGLNVAIWEQPNGLLDWGAGSSNRDPNIPWKYTSIGTDPNASLWLTAVGVPGLLPSLVDANSEYRSHVNADPNAGAGDAKAYLEVASIPGLGTGSFNDSLDTDYYGAADLYMDMATTLVNPTNTVDPNGDDFTVTSNDDVTGMIVPEPVTMLAVFLGIGGLGGYVRKRTKV